MGQTLGVNLMANTRKPTLKINENKLEAFS